ncbi:hypothetical protein L0Y49_02300 [bacterium]|nr:hypothetical protein [bacterium]
MKKAIPLFLVFGIVLAAPAAKAAQWWEILGGVAAGDYVYSRITGVSPIEAILRGGYRYSQPAALYLPRYTPPQIIYYYIQPPNCGTDTPGSHRGALHHHGKDGEREVAGSLQNLPGILD